MLVGELLNVCLPKACFLKDPGADFYKFRSVYLHSSLGVSGTGLQTLGSCYSLLPVSKTTVVVPGDCVAEVTLGPELRRV